MITTQSRPLAVAHRGSAQHAIGNTLPAFQQGVNDGADVLELAVIHDDTLERTHGHPDHVRVSAATVLAVRGLSRRPSLYYGVIPHRVVDEFARAFSEAGLRAKGRAAAAGADMDRDAGVPDEAVTATIDVSAYVRAKRDAVRAHGTQMTGHVLLRLPEPVLARLWQEEHFALHGSAGVGPVSRDLFEPG